MAPADPWPSVSYEDWSETCDTLHAHTQVLGKIAATLAPPEPQLQHAALRLTARGWETEALPAPDGSGALLLALDLHITRGCGRAQRRPHSASSSRAGPRGRDRRPRAAGRRWPSWSGSSRSIRRHRRCRGASRSTRTRSTRAMTPTGSPPTRGRDQAALVLAAFRAPFRGRSQPRSTPGGARSISPSTSTPGSRPTLPRRTSSCATRWIPKRWRWDGGPGTPNWEAAFYAYAHPAPEGFGEQPLAPPAARWEADLGLYLLDWDDVRASDDPHAFALSFARSAFQHACLVCGWDEGLAASAEGAPPPVV